MAFAVPFLAAFFAVLAAAFFAGAALAGPMAAGEVAAAVDLAGLAGVHGLRTDHGRVLFDVDADALEPALATLVKVGVKSLVSAPPSLEELFLRQYQAGDGS